MFAFVMLILQWIMMPIWVLLACALACAFLDSLPAPQKATKAEKKHVAGVSFTSLALNLSMLIVGAEYNSEEHCKLEASEYMTNSI